MTRIVALTAAALAVLAVVLIVVLTHRPHVSQTAPLHAKLLPVHPSVVSRPAIIPGGPAHNLMPYDPVSGQCWVSGREFCVKH
jgi:hypothetical protein